MCKCLTGIISMTLGVLAFIYTLNVLSLTKINTFNQPFAPNEREKFFLNKATNPLIQLNGLSFKCQMYEDIIMNPNVTKLGDIFNLKIDLMHKKIGTLLTVLCLTIVLLIFSIICIFYSTRAQNLSFACLSCLMIIALFGLIIWHFTLLFQSVAIFFTSDINQWIQFINCENINKEGFNRYLYAEDLYNNFKSFIILNLILIIWNLATNNSDNKATSQRNNNTNINGIELSENLVN